MSRRSFPSKGQGDWTDSCWKLCNNPSPWKTLFIFLKTHYSHPVATMLIACVKSHHPQVAQVCLFFTLQEEMEIAYTLKGCKSLLNYISRNMCKYIFRILNQRGHNRTLDWAELIDKNALNVSRFNALTCAVGCGLSHLVGYLSAYKLSCKIH